VGHRSAGAQSSDDSEKQHGSSNKTSSKDEGGDVVSVQAVELLMEKTDSPDEKDQDVIAEVPQPKPAACCVIS
jgi:hypothetical protein